MKPTNSIVKATQPKQAFSPRSKKLNFGRKFLLGVMWCALIGLSILSVQNGMAENDGQTLAPLPGLTPAQVKSANEDRIRFAKERRPIPSHGLYEDFRAQRQGEDLWIPGYGPEGRPIPGSGLRVTGAGTNEVPLSVTLKPEAGSSNGVIHILGRGLTDSLIREALTNGHAYVANDWICDPTGFMFGAVNNQGVFTMGDTVTLYGKTKVMAVNSYLGETSLASRRRSSAGNNWNQSYF